MKKPLSYSSINTYTTCGQKYKLRYIDGYRNKYAHAALLFGSAIDKALNTLLETKELDKAKIVFQHEWHQQFINKKLVTLSHCIDIVYADADLDLDLLKEPVLVEFINAKELKKQFGWDNLKDSDKEVYNYTNWLCLREKGYIMLQSYFDKVLPKIKEVVAVQKTNELKSEHDTIIQYLDLVVRWYDNSVILFDNKTSSREYEKDSPSRSPQLLSYYYGSKDELKIDKVGFIVLSKHIIKNKTKICSICFHNGSGKSHRTCDNIVEGKRCNSQWSVSIDPECKIDVIINDVPPIAEELVMDTFSQASDGINNKVFNKNLNACKNGPIVCEFYKLCWNKDDSDIVKKD